MTCYRVEVLQGYGEWMGWGEADAEFMQANQRAVEINERHFTATRVLNDMGAPVLYVLPQFPEVAYPGKFGAAARDVLRKFE